MLTNLILSLSLVLFLSDERSTFSWLLNHSNYKVTTKKMATEEQVLKDEKITKPKSKYPSFTENLREYFYDYSNKTSMHGIRYLGEKERSLTERSVKLNK